MDKASITALTSYLRELLKTTGDKTKVRHAKGLIVRIIELRG